VLASLRAELLVLRKWRGAWALLAVAPLYTLLAYYVLPYISYVNDTPARYATLGPPSQLLPAMLPSQFVIVAVAIQAAPFAVLGAMMAGGDWSRGTIKTALQQGPRRAATFIGQAVAMAVACAASVAANFAVAGAASLVLRSLAAGAVTHAGGAMPGAGVLARGLGVGLLIAVLYGAGGLALGTLFRSTSGAIAVAVLWTVIVAPVLYDLTLEVGGVVKTIGDLLPQTSAESITATFGALGGGAGTSMYYPVSPAVTVWVLLGYTAAFLAVALAVLRFRDVGAGAPSRMERRLAIWRRPGRTRAAAPVIAVPPDRPAGVLTSLRAELLILSRRPAVWAFVLAPPVAMLLNSYLLQYVYYRAAASGTLQGLSPIQILPAILPGQFMTVSLNSLGFSTGVDGTVPFFLLGALVAGSDWDRGTIRTSLLQGPGRLRTVAGQILAVMAALAVSAVCTVILAAAASAMISLTLTGSAATESTAFPAAGQVAGGVAAALLISVAYGAVGWGFGTLFRSAGAAIAVALLWADIVALQLDQTARTFPGALLRIYQFLPDASTNTLSNLFGTAYSPVIPAPVVVQITPAIAFTVLIAYAAVFFAGPGLLIRRRDIT
jgi:ABC-2 type transport system permease protein